MYIDVIDYNCYIATCLCVPGWLVRIATLNCSYTHRDGNVL